ncbi:hypothetical protein B0A48_15177 [Cryoendolithus antarcticus]|uniref:Uncharacterized protein n=1 Tax=Cryoendolithus antarcticus TaxID=1507870 RepID=A0A1V8SIY6_9PEZI|nr:hypothetical protein B0A48_15177 [Cryoendolithus antarcticus]
MSTRIPERRATLLTLPVEVRNEIYSYLLPKRHHLEKTTYIRGSSVSVSHRPPQGVLLLIHPVISQELFDYHRHVARYHLIISHGFALTGEDRDFNSIFTPDVLKCIRHLDIYILANAALLRSFPSETPETAWAEIGRRLEGLCKVFAHSPYLKRVNLRWFDGLPPGPTQLKLKILEVLGTLPREVSFVVDRACYARSFPDIHPPSKVLRQAVDEVIRRLNER